MNRFARWTLALLAIAWASPVVADEPFTVGPLDLATAARYFAEFDSLCARDGGAIWGASYAGPLLFADPGTRRVVANRADPQGVLERRGDVYTGVLPDSLPVANTAVNWLGARWTMLMAWGVPSNLRPRLRLMGHEAFHRLQPQLGLESPGGINAHLDTRDGRYWLQLEWNALQAALGLAGAARRDAVRDARVFRAARRLACPGAEATEVPLEIHEGVAEYAGARLVGYADAEVVRLVAARRGGETSLVRSFAYVSGPLYGFLLDGASPGWRRALTPRADLGDLLAAAMQLPTVSPREAEPRAARALAARYGGDTLWRAEVARDRQRRERIVRWTKELVTGPVLRVDLARVKSGSFDPGQVFPLGEGRTVYTVRTLTAEWGTLEVEDGAILEDGAWGRVSLTGADPARTHGRGWKLTLAEGWTVVAGPRKGDGVVVRK